MWVPALEQREHAASWNNQPVKTRYMDSLCLQRWGSTELVGRVKYEQRVQGLLRMYSIIMPSNQIVFTEAIFRISHKPILPLRIKIYQV